MYAAHRVVQSRMSNAKAEQPSPGAGPKICLNPLVMCLLSCADGWLPDSGATCHSHTAPTSAAQIMKREKAHQLGWKLD